MSIETDFQTLLLGFAPLANLVGDDVAQDTLPEGTGYPAVVFAATHDRTIGLDGALLSDQCTLVTQCWAADPADASAVADQVIAAIATAPPAVGAMVLDRSTTHNEENGAHGVVLTSTWWFLAS